MNRLAQQKRKQIINRGTRPPGSKRLTLWPSSTSFREACSRANASSCSNSRFSYVRSLFLLSNNICATLFCSSLNCFCNDFTLAVHSASLLRSALSMATSCSALSISIVRFRLSLSRLNAESFSSTRPACKGEG